MDIAERKLSIIKWLSSTQDEALLSRVEMLIKSAPSEFYDEYMRPSTLAQKEQLLKESEADYKAGRTFTQEEMEQRYKINK